MKIIVFGGVGFIGTNVVLEAVARGHSVVVADNLKRIGVTENLSILLHKKNIEFIHLDIRCTPDFHMLPKGIECIINLAANPSVPKSIQDPQFDFETNVTGHLNILEYSRTHGKIPVLFASSNKVYTDKINSLPLVEDTTRYRYRDERLRTYGINEHADVDGFDGYTNSPYGSGKLAAEKYTREYFKHYKVPVVANRMSCIYGLYQKGVEEQGWLDWFLRAKKTKQAITIYGNGKQVRDVLFGSDVAKLYLYQAENIEKVSGKTFNVGGGNQDGFHTSLLEVIELINSHFPGPQLKFSIKPWRSSDQRVYISDIRSVSESTGWKPTTPIIKGLEQMWNTYVS